MSAAQSPRGEQPQEQQRSGEAQRSEVDPLERELRRMAVLHRRDVTAVRRTQNRRQRALPGPG